MSQPRGFNLQPARPAWGIRPPVRKTLSTSRPLAVAPLPEQVIIPVHQSLGHNAVPVVSPGQRVRTGEVIAERVNTPGSAVARVHASISGRVSAIEPRHIAGTGDPVGLCIIIDGDGLDERHPDCQPADPADLPADEIIKRIAEAGIVGLGGALFETATKMSGGKTLSGLILNGAECEPYITCDEMLMRERADAVVQGATIMLRALGNPDAVIAVESDMPEARVALHDAIDAQGSANISVAVVTANYPAGGERQLIELITGQEVPLHGLPADIGYLCHNVATAAAVADLFTKGEPLISRVVTLTGKGLAAPQNVVARIGTLVSDLIGDIGGYAASVDRLLMGGPMMGIALARDDIPVSKATNCIIAMPGASRGTARQPPPELPCIRCAECSEVCPANLLPQQLLVACRMQDNEALDELGLDACIECGCCDFVCPSYIPLTSRFIAGKRILAAHRNERLQAEHARSRYEAREQRLVRDEHALGRDLEKQVEELQDPGTLDAVMKRVAKRDQQDS